MLSLPRIEHALYGAFFVMVACCVPLVQVTLDTLKFDRSRAQTCGVWTPKAPGDTGYSGGDQQPWVTGQRPPRCGGWWCINSPKV